jgi:DNA-binding NarL/FixJ family response regulator
MMSSRRLFRKRLEARAQSHARAGSSRGSGDQHFVTPGERRIAERAAAGASNAEIAQALFVTVKTVEMHLSNAYCKLDIASRRELTRALRE